jgi:hypothetical protein
MNYLHKTILVILCLVFGWSSTEAASFTGVEMELQRDVIDLQPSSFRGKRGDSRTIKDLRVGSIFIDVDGKAKKVTRIYQEGDTVTIETEQPRPEEVFNGLTIPDQSIAFTAEDIIPESLHPGVTILNNDPVKGIGVDTSSGDIAVSMSINLLEGAASDSNLPDNDSLKGNTEGAITLEGTLTLKKPSLNVYCHLPRLKFTWRGIKQRSGNIGMSVSGGQELELKLSGGITYNNEKRILLFGVKIPGGIANATLGAYLVTSVNGSISLEFVVLEEFEFTFGSSSDLRLAWTLFRLSNTRSTSDVYFGTSISPIVSAQAGLRSGLALGVDLRALGFELINLEGGSGIYAELDGLIAPGSGEDNYLIKYDTDNGLTNNLRTWTVSADFDTGIYVEAGLQIFKGLVDVTFFDRQYSIWHYELY